jgi:hypothetical protein
VTSEDDAKVESPGEVPDDALEGCSVDRSWDGAVSTDDSDGVREVRTSRDHEVHERSDGLEVLALVGSSELGFGVKVVVGHKGFVLVHRSAR